MLKVTIQRDSFTPLEECAVFSPVLPLSGACVPLLTPCTFVVLLYLCVGLYLGDTSPVHISAIPLLPPYVIGMFQVVSLVYLKNSAFRGIILCFVSIRTLKKKKKKFMGGKINNPTTTP